jgi:hypothetical protein
MSIVLSLKPLKDINYKVTLIRLKNKIQYNTINNTKEDKVANRETAKVKYKLNAKG